MHLDIASYYNASMVNRSWNFISKDDLLIQNFALNRFKPKQFQKKICSDSPVVC